LFASYHRERVIKTPEKTELDFLRNEVFNLKTMPWFDEQYRFPSQDWKSCFAAVFEPHDSASAADSPSMAAILPEPFSA
jgi:hypothetical protein